MRTGQDYIKSLDDGRTFYLNGGQIENVATHAGFREAAQSIARLYDLVANPANRELLTYPSPKTSVPVNKTFMTYTSKSTMALTVRTRAIRGNTRSIKKSWFGPREL
jgi:4-hydroxyphenylacetate 3-monooxygenase